MKIKAQHKLRQPTGAFVVGCAYTSFEYTPAGAQTPRTIPVLTYYPASSKGEGTLRKYIHESILPGAEGIETNSFLGAPMTEGKHPTLLFSHGLTLSHEVHTIQCEELASHGYIVVSIGHPGGGSYALPNGDLILFDHAKAAEDPEAQLAATRSFLQFTEWMKQTGTTAAADEHIPEYQRMIERDPEIIERANEWIADSLAAIDWILAQAQQPGTLLYEQVDADRFGAFGMSFGGSTAMSLTFASDVVQAAANLDGFFYSTYWRQPLTKPTLLLNNDSAHGFLRYPFLNAQGDVYLAIVRDTTHGGFTDYTVILAENDVMKVTVDGVEVEFPTLGSIDPDRMETIMNRFLLAFFNKYLKSEPSGLLDGDEQPEDVTLLRKLAAR